MLELPEILEQFTTLTAYGEKEKMKKLQPFSPERQDELIMELAELAGIIKLLNSLPKEKTLELKDLMQQLPDIQLELDYFSVKATLNSPMLFNLTKFLYLAKELNQLLETAGWWENARSQWQHREESYRLLKITDNYRFYLGNFGDEAYLQLVQEIQLAEKELGRLAAALEEEILQAAKMTGISFNNELLELELKNKLSQLKDKLRAAEQAILENLSAQLASCREYFSQLADKIGRLDWLLARGFFAVNHGCTVPVVSLPKAGEKGRLAVTAGIHPIVRAKLKQQGAAFVPVSIDLKPGVALLTGANMGGKTIALKTAGTLLAMAQLGLPVTAAKVEFAPVDFIFFSAAKDITTVGLSSFGAEIQALNEILKVKDKLGLVLLDEPARGTNPEEGAALAHAFLKVLEQGDCLVLVTTHFDRLIKEDSFVQWQVKGLKNLAGLANLAEIYQSFDYGLEKITAREQVPRDALKVARLMKVDNKVLELAEKYLASKP
jgi:DNA mismatch repair ATPase MutS